MNRLLAKVIDEYALYQLHRQKSVTSQFKALESISMPENPTLFYFEPKTPNLIFEDMSNSGNYQTGSFKYKSEVENAKCNEYATGTFFQNKQNTSLNVILVHGWRQDTERIKAIYLNPFMNHGYDMYFVTLPHHTERQDSTLSYNGEFMISANIERTLSSVRQAVVDLRALISWLRANRPAPVVLVGISLGGLIVNLAATSEKNIDGAITVFSPNSLSHAIWHNVPGKYIKRDFEESDYTYDQLKTQWAMLNTGNFDIMMPKEKVLILSALHDRYIDFKDASRLWEKWDKPERKLYHCGHAGIVLYKKSIAEDSVEFIERKVMEGAKMR
ncbi:alpha/beta hydrolase fold-1 [Lucifera butyrica]|uniref:Alpha/beta hydrolase fold-1 n=1 Tax=Lucifera butyrica TaxID=1351585 RepID=A0A498R8C9_9FIRM|nr:alpha/beta fold hydrolase [Lucifera butyrica]VBB07177.1 alpha/beta hydrolase fold-1 [Lucifera butyrica]